jgi:hypothetical protein
MEKMLLLSGARTRRGRKICTCAQTVRRLSVLYLVPHHFKLYVHKQTYEVVSESSRTAIDVIALTKEGRGGQDLCHVTEQSKQALFLHECFFNFVFHFACDEWKNRAKCVHQVLCEAVNLLSNPLKWFLRLMESIL